MEGFQQKKKILWIYLVHLSVEEDTGRNLENAEATLGRGWSESSSRRINRILAPLTCSSWNLSARCSSKQHANLLASSHWLALMLAPSWSSSVVFKETQSQSHFPASFSVVYLCVKAADWL